MGKLGDYEIETELGRGSMGVVYLAHDPRLHRRVALKTIQVPQGVDPAEVDAFRERFLREAQAAGGISHPGIVTIYGVDECEDEVLPFISMEYVPGANLRQILGEQGRLDPPRAFRIADSLADALYSAHNAGVVHRDIKPANVLVRDPDEVVKIADFGVARLSLSELTRAGQMVGSPAYMAPEQIRDGQADERSDLFALGVMLYEMLCGERPFDGPDIPAIVHRVVSADPVPITQRVPGLPGVINAFFDRALAKSPRDRFQDAAEFRQALNDVQLEYQIGLTGDLVSEAAAVKEVVQPLPEAGEVVGRHHLRQYLVFGTLFAIFVIGWAFLGKGSPESPSIGPPTAVDAAPIPFSVSPPVVEALPDALGGPDLGESVLTPEELGIETPEPPLEAEPAQPEAEVQVSKPTPPVTTALPRPRPTREPDAAKIEEVAEALDAAAAAAASAAAGEPADVEIEAPESAAVEPAVLSLVTRTALKDGTLTLFVDGEETSTLDLASEGSRFKRFSKALTGGKRQEAGLLDLPPGPHRILARVSRPDKDRVLEATLDVDLAAGETRDLVIVVGRLFGSALTLKLE